MLSPVEDLSDSDLQKISDKFASMYFDLLVNKVSALCPFYTTNQLIVNAEATSFRDIAAAYQMICEQYRPEGEKSIGEFVVSLLLLPWGLPTFARHVSIDHNGQVALIADVSLSPKHTIYINISPPDSI